MDGDAAAGPVAAPGIGPIREPLDRDSQAQLRALLDRARAHRVAGDAPISEVPSGFQLGLLDVLLRRSLDAIVLNARATRWILEVSESFETLTGYRRGEMIGRTSVELGLVDADTVRQESIRRADEGVGGVYETRLRCKDGELRWIEYTQQLLSPEFVLTIVRDITDRKSLEADLRLLADTDALTGIFNRRRFEQEVQRQIRESRRFGDPVTLVVIDLDEFKMINDRYGHQTGDAVLCAVGQALRHAVRETDVIGRIGGDEFAALLTRATPAGADRVIANFLAALGEKMPDIVGGADVQASVGAATGVGPDLDYEALLSTADRRMYAGKNGRRWSPGAPD